MRSQAKKRYVHVRETQEKGKLSDPELQDENGVVDESRMVRKFHRSAAGDESPSPSDLRPPAVLKRVCDYLFNSVVGPDADVAKLARVHTYVWDRTRAVRNDFSIQQVTKLQDLKFGIDCFEQIVRFHICTIHQLSAPDQPPQGSYNAKQDREQMDKALLSLMQYYDDCRGRYQSPHEPEFRAYCILLDIQSRIPDLEDRVQMWPRHIVSDLRVQVALKLHAAATNTADFQGPLSATRQLVARQDWRQFWRLMRSSKVSYLMGCVAETYANRIRRIALQAIVRTTRKVKRDQPVGLDWTIDKIRPYFCFDDDEQLEEFLGCYNLGLRTDQDVGTRCLELTNVLASSTLPAPIREPTQYKTRIIEKKRRGRTLPAVIEGLTYQQAEEAGKVVDEVEADDKYGEAAGGTDDEMQKDEEDDDDDEGLFVKQPKKSTTAPENTASTATATTVSGFNFATPSAGAGSPFAPSSLAQMSANPFAHNAQTTAGDQGSTPKFTFATASSTSGSAFSVAPSTSPFAVPSVTSTAATPSGLGISSGDAPAKTSLFSGFAQSSSTAAPSLFAPSAPSASAEMKSTGPDPSWNFSTLATDTAKATTVTPASEPASKLSFSWGQQGGSSSAATATKVSVPLDLNSKSAPASPTAQTNATSTSPLPHNAHDTGAPAINSGSLSPTRRQSINHGQDTRPKRPSPLSNSFTAEDGPVSDAAKAASAAAKQTPRGLSPSRASGAGLSIPAPPASASSEFDAIVTRLANELTSDPVSGLIKQYVQQHVRCVISQVQSKIYDEALEAKRQQDRRDRWKLIATKYFVRWKGKAHVKALRRKGNERRNRTRYRYLAPQVEEGKLDASVLDAYRTRSNSRASSTNPQTKEHQRIDALFRSQSRTRSSVTDMQARAGSKRPASALDGEMPPPPTPYGHKRAKSSSQVDDRDEPARSTLTSDPRADILRRSSFLGFSLPSNAPRASTTKTSYFRMKAMGLKPVPDVGPARGTKRSRSESLDEASAKLEESRLGNSLPRSGSHRESSVRSSSTISDRSKVNNDDEALFARLKAAREALKDGGNFMRSEVRGEELQRGRSASRSAHDSPSMDKARAEAQLHASAAHSEYSASAVSSRDVPAYRLRESRFVPREQYGRAIERANEFRASRSRETSRPASRGETHKVPGPNRPDPGIVPQQFGKGNTWKEDPRPTANGANHSSTLSSLGLKPSATPREVSRPVFGFGVQQESWKDTAANPFSQSSSFATVGSNGVNPFLQPAAPHAPPANPFTQRQAPAAEFKPSPFSQNATSSSSWSLDPPKRINATYATEQPSFDFGFPKFSNPTDQTVQPEHVPTALSHTFGTTATPMESQFAPATHGSATPPQTGSYMPSHAASEAISLLSDDAEDDEQMPNGQDDSSIAMDNAADFNPDSTASYGVAARAAQHSAYAGQFAAIANHDEEEGEGEDDDLEQYSGGSDEDVSAEDGEDTDEQEPDSYPYGDVVDDEEISEEDEVPNGHYRGSDEPFSDEEGAEGEDGDIEDYDEQDYDEDEEEDDLDGAPYANTYRSQAEALTYKPFVPPVPNQALQGVGNNEDDAIELSD